MYVGKYVCTHNEVVFTSPYDDTSLHKGHTITKECDIHTCYKKYLFAFFMLICGIISFSGVVINESTFLNCRTGLYE